MLYCCVDVSRKKLSSLSCVQCMLCMKFHPQRWLGPHSASIRPYGAQMARLFRFKRVFNVKLLKTRHIFLTFISDNIKINYIFIPILIYIHLLYDLLYLSCYAKQFHKKGCWLYVVDNIVAYCWNSIRYSFTSCTTLPP